MDTPSAGRLSPTLDRRAGPAWGSATMPYSGRTATPPEETEEAEEEVDPEDGWAGSDDAEWFTEENNAFVACVMGGGCAESDDEEAEDDDEEAGDALLSGDDGSDGAALAHGAIELAPLEGEVEDWGLVRESPEEQAEARDFAHLDSLRIGRHKGLVNGFAMAVPDSTVGFVVTFMYAADPHRGGAGLEAYSDWRSAHLPMPYENPDEAEGGREGETLAQVMVAFVEGGAGAAPAPAALADDVGRGVKAVARVRNREAELALEAVPEVGGGGPPQGVGRSPHRPSGLRCWVG